MDLHELTMAERLVAEQAVLGYREVHRAMKGAPHGRGLAVIEQAVVTRMRLQGVAMMTEALREASAAEQKGGDAASAGGRPRAGASRG
ncbi:MAG: hypothetical protein ACRD3A_01855 [Terriglobales bacterium]